MKRFVLALAAFAMLAGGVGVAQQLRTQNYMDVGYWGVGATLDILSGGTLKFKGVANNIARGEVALRGTNPTAVQTGLTTPSQCSVTLKGTAAPTPTLWVSYGVSGGTINIYAWKPTAIDNVTPIASEGTETVGWSCKGT